MIKNYSVTALAAILVALPFVAGAQMNANGNAPTDTSHQTMPSSETLTRNLGMGATGSDVSLLQSMLVAHGYLNLPNGVATGYFGAKTRVAVMAFQRANGISPTGYVGVMTLAKLNAHHGNGSGMPMTDTKAAELRVLLNAIERQHVDLASAATRAGFDGHGSFDAAAKELDKNSIELSKAVGSVYGADAEAQFLQIWRSHITFFVNYTVAAKKGDQAGMDKAVGDLAGYVDNIADFFSKANPNLPREAVHQLVSQHVTLLKATVDAYGAGNYAGSYEKQTAAYNQIGTIADATAGAIVKQFPQKF